jgi:tetratricopeptide (TPR) repeat protein/serine/threonine protein kinase
MSSSSHSGIVLQLAEEFLERYRQGQRPSLKEYIDRHPELAAEIKEVFPAMALMENVALADESLAGEPTGEAPATDQKPPEQLGDFRILREVGRGGMGIVYEAEQMSLGRHVALKVLPRKILVDDQQRRRFEREAKAAAKLHHTNIVPVFGVGEHDGLPYYVMQFIQGLGLDDVLDELKRMQVGGTATATGGELRISREDVSAADVARSLLTGAFQDGEGGASAPSFSPHQGADAPRSPESGTSGKLSDSFTLSGSVKLPGSDAAVQSKGKKATYWQSVAQIGVQVAQALEYAHKQGIQHRDIKPSNLLLDTRGTVWVTDFGLARADNEDHLTQTGDIVGTLRYMPPEAFEGLADKRGDIYSLGLTLYELLARRPAYEERDRHRLIKRVTTEEPERLDKLNRSIPRDLVTIVQKTIDREPGRRYQTAGELAADLQRFLGDEPIQARRISQGERLLRWCRHYPGVATLTAALAVVLLTVTVVSLLAAARFDRLAREQAATAQSEREARQAVEQAMNQTEAAKRQAEANFDKARQAVDDYLTKVSESRLLQVPGLHPLRRELLQSALAFYQDFLKERGDDPALRGELAAAFLRVGKLRGMLGERDEAKKAHDQARQLFEALLTAAPDSIEWRHGLAECNYWLGRFDEAISLWQKLIQPDKPDFRKELAAAYNSRAFRYTYAGKHVEALEANQQALACLEILVRLNPDDADAQRVLGRTLHSIGVLLAKMGRSADALAMYRRAVAHTETAFAQAPQEIRNGYDVANSQGYIAITERQLGHVEEATAAYQRSIEVSRRLARDNPALPSSHSFLYWAYRSLADYQRELKQTEQADKNMRLAHEAIERMPNYSPTDLYNLACARALCSKPLNPENDKPTTEEKAERRREADQAMDALRKAIAAGFRDLDLLRRDSDLNVLRGRADFKALEADLAARVAAAQTDKLQASRQALAQRQKLAEANPENKRFRADLAASQHAMALIQLDLGKLDEAQKHLQQAIALREALVKQEPKNTQYQTDLTASRFAVGEFHWRSGRLAEGAKTWQHNLDALETAARQGQDPSLAGQLLAMRRTIGQHYAQAGLWSEAAAHFGRLVQEGEVPMQDHFRAACLALRAGDAPAYLRLRERMTKRASDPRGPFAPGWLSWADVLADHSGMDPSAAIQRTRAMTDKNPALPWQSHILGLAHYRAGQFAEAIAQASKFNTLNSAWHARVTSGPVLAMTHHRLGHAAEARQWLEKSQQEWCRLSPLMHSPGGATVLPSRSSPWTETWQDWPTFEILLREASLLITGEPPVEAAYDHAHRSLLYSQLGDSEKAEAEWQAALKIAPRELALWLARGRIFAQLGQHDKADAAFAKAAELTPDELDRFPQAGWWVIGPYPDNLKLSCPPEVDPDPSSPVVSTGAAPDLHWRSVPTEPGGLVQLRTLFNAGHVSAYALTYVYSPRERTATLCIGGDDRVRVWLNGRLVHQTNRKMDAPIELDRIPVTLRSGRNTLLCKVSRGANAPNFYLRLRIGDNPLDRAIVHAKLGSWDEAAPLFARYLDQHPSADVNSYARIVHALLLAGDRAGCQRYVHRMFERYGQDRPAHEYGWVAYAGGLPEGGIESKRLVEVAERALENDNSPYVFHAAGIAYYRAGQWEKAIGRLEESLKFPAWQNEGGHSSELALALAHHRLGHAQQARQWLDKAEVWYEKAIQNALDSPTGKATLYYWADWPSFVILRREAHKSILGSDGKDDPRLVKLADGLRDWLKKRNPAVADYDVAIFLAPWEPHLWLARGLRFAQMKRNKEAEADFAKAVQLQSGGTEVWRERGRIHFELGQIDKAAADFRKLVELLGGNSELADPESDKILDQMPDDAMLPWLTAAIQTNPEQTKRRWQRGEWYARRTRWKEAAADFKMALELNPPDTNLEWLHAAPTLAAAGDREGYQRLYSAMRKRFGASQNVGALDQLAKLGLLLPDAGSDTEWAAQLADQAVVLGKDLSWEPYFVFGKGLADYRRGKYRASAEQMNSLLHRIVSKKELDSSRTPILSRLDLSVCCHLVLAMSLHRQGQTKPAREHLAQAGKLIDHALSESAPFPLERPGRYSHDWLIAWLLHREAKERIEGKKAEPQK